MTQSGANKRKNRRVSAAGLAAYLHTGQSAQLEPRFVEDISSGGAFIRTDAVLEIGTPVALILVRPGLKKAVKLTAKVVGRRASTDAKRPPGLRVAFDLVTEQTALKIVELLASLGKKDISTAIKVIDELPMIEATVDRPEKLLTPPLPAGKPTGGEQWKNLERALELSRQDVVERDRQIAALETQLARARQVITARDEHIKALTAKRQ